MRTKINIKIDMSSIEKSSVNVDRCLDIQIDEKYSENIFKTNKILKINTDQKLANTD